MNKNKICKINKATNKNREGKQLVADSGMRNSNNKCDYSGARPIDDITSVLSGIITTITHLQDHNGICGKFAHLHNNNLESDLLISKLQYTFKCPECGEIDLTAHVGMNEYKFLYNAAICYVFTRCITEYGFIINRCKDDHIRKYIEKGKLIFKFSCRCNKCNYEGDMWLSDLQI